MPCAEEVYAPHRVGIDQVHGDPRRAMAKFRQVWNTYMPFTGTSVVIPEGHPLTGTNTLIVPSMPCRRKLILTVDNRTGTADLFLMEGGPAAMHSGIGPLISHGSNYEMDGHVGIYYGVVHGVHNGAGPLRVNIYEGYSLAPPFDES